LIEKRLSDTHKRNEIVAARANMYCTKCGSREFHFGEVIRCVKCGSVTFEIR